MSGASEWLARSAEARLTELAESFREHFGHGPEAIASAPGRVNLIGEHVDYNGGAVLPVAIDRSVLVAYRPRADDLVQGYSRDLEQSTTFRLGQRIQPGQDHRWADYLRGVVVGLIEAWGLGRGLDLAISSNVPIGAGLSSSAALEVAVAGALREAWSLPVGDKELALLCQRAENTFVGVQCGIMDQFASALGRADSAVLIDCASLEHEYVPLPFEAAGLTLVVVDSGQRRQLEASDYNLRREECWEALRLLRAEDAGLASLGGASPDLIERVRLHEILKRRTRHVITECDRLRRAVASLRCGDLVAFGTLLNESHASLRDDFEVSTPQLDRLVGLAQGQEGVLGARLTGAGFGGCTVNVVVREALEDFARDVVGRYADETGLDARMLVCRASDGLRVQRL